MKIGHFRDEQKGAFFLFVMFLIILFVSIFIGVSLRTDTVGSVLASDQVIRILNVMEDDKHELAFSDVLIYYPVSKKATLVNIPGNTGAIYQSIDRVDRIDSVYNEKGVDAYKREVEKLLGCTIPFYMIFSKNNFCYITDLLSGLRVFIPSPVDSISETGERWLLPSGAVNLDGDKILA